MCFLAAFLTPAVGGWDKLDLTPTLVFPFFFPPGFMPLFSSKPGATFSSKIVIQTERITFQAELAFCLLSLAYEWFSPLGAMVLMRLSLFPLAMLWG